MPSGVFERFRRTGCGRWLGVAALLAAACGSAPRAAADEVRLEQDRLARLAEHVSTAGADQRLDFIRAALGEMHEAYRREVERSLHDAPVDPARRAKLLRWRSATGGFLQELQSVLFQLEGGAEFDVYLDPRERVVISVGGRALLVSGPRGAADRALGQAVVNGFCRRADCSGIVERDPATPAEPPGGDVRARWAMSSRGPADLVTADGLVFRFRDMRDKADKEAWALALTRDLVRLAERLQRASARGNAVDWAGLTIRPDPARRGLHRAGLNDGNDFIRVELPALGRQSELLAHARPWLEHRSRGGAPPAPVVLAAFVHYPGPPP